MKKRDIITLIVIIILVLVLMTFFKPNNILTKTLNLTIFKGATNQTQIQQTNNNNENLTENQTSNQNQTNQISNNNTNTNLVACSLTEHFGCFPISQGWNPPSGYKVPIVCGCIPNSCPQGTYLVVSGAEGTWLDGSQKGLFACSDTLPS